jgi:hypothetical protein
MANAQSQNRFNVSFTRSQLELLENMLGQEIHLLETGYAHPHPQILKRTFDAVYFHLQPSPEAKQKKFERWVKKVSVGAREARQRNEVARSEFPMVAL